MHYPADIGPTARRSKALLFLLTVVTTVANRAIFQWPGFPQHNVLRFFVKKMTKVATLVVRKSCVVWVFCGFKRRNRHTQIFSAKLKASRTHSVSFDDIIFCSPSNFILRSDKTIFCCCFKQLLCQTYRNIASWICFVSSTSGHMATMKKKESETADFLCCWDKVS